MVKNVCDFLGVSVPELFVLACDWYYEVVGIKYEHEEEYAFFLRSGEYPLVIQRYALSILSSTGRLYTNDQMIDGALVNA